MLLPSTTYLMVYVVIIPLGIVGLVQFTCTELLLTLVTVLMIGGVGAVNGHIYVYVRYVYCNVSCHTCFKCCNGCRITHWSSRYSNSTYCTGVISECIQTRNSSHCKSTTDISLEAIKQNLIYMRARTTSVRQM